MKAHRFALPLLLLCLLPMCACSDPDRPKLGVVTGRVTRDGQPLEGACVLFKAPGAPGGMGVTDAEGRYELTYVGKYRGAVIGENTVTVFVHGDSADPDAGEGMTVLYEGSRQVEAKTQTFDFDL